MFRVLPAFVLVCLAAVAACSSSPTAPSPDLEGGVVATFDVSGTRFNVFVTNPAAISRLIRIDRGAELGQIPNGRIRRGAGAGSHNAPFSWHLDPEDIEIVDAAIELCDGNPSYVENHVDEFVDVVGRYCPWGAELVDLKDYR